MVLAIVLFFTIMVMSATTSLEATKNPKAAKSESVKTTGIAAAAAVCLSALLGYFVYTNWNPISMTGGGGGRMAGGGGGGGGLGGGLGGFRAPEMGLNNGPRGILN